jgi:hypothetical protein
MPTLSNPGLPNPSNTAAPSIAPRRMLRLNKAGWIIKALASLFVVAFLCAYARTYSRYGTPHTQTRASLTHPVTQAFTPTRLHLDHHRRLFIPARHAFVPVRHTRRRPQHASLYHLATLRRIRRFFSQLLVVRS